jgi:CheY-like chemotaxis protein
VPVVALTAHAANEAGAESLAAGCDGHLAKPVERKDLVETIASSPSRKGFKKSVSRR